MALSPRLPSFPGKPDGLAGATGVARTGSATEMASEASPKLASPSVGRGSTNCGCPRLLLRRRAAGGRYFRGKVLLFLLYTLKHNYILMHMAGGLYVTILLNC